MVGVIDDSATSPITVADMAPSGTNSNYATTTLTISADNTVQTGSIGIGSIPTASSNQNTAVAFDTTQYWTMVTSSACTTCEGTAGAGWYDSTQSSLLL